MGSAWLQPLVLAILAGAALRSLLGLAPAFVPGVNFAAKTLLEVAIVLLGASMSLRPGRRPRAAGRRRHRRGG